MPVPSYLYESIYDFQAEVMVSSGGKDALKTHPFLAADSVQKLTAQAYRKLKDHVPALKQSFSLYIANSDTENILITPVKVGYLQAVVFMLI